MFQHEGRHAPHAQLLQPVLRLLRAGRVCGLQRSTAVTQALCGLRQTQSLQALRHMRGRGHILPVHIACMLQKFERPDLVIPP